MFSLLRSALLRAGLLVRRIGPPGSWRRPVGELPFLLEDLRARGLDPRHILDVGGNRGRWTREARHVFPAARSTIFEPQEEMRPHLEALTREVPRCEWVQAAVGRAEGTADFTIHPDSESSSLLYDPAEAAARGWATRTVPVVTLDDWMQRLGGPPPELVKIDVEGHEAAAIAGGQATLRSAEVVMAEVALLRLREGQPTLTQILAAMEALGHQAYDFSFFQRRGIDGALAVAEVVFARQGSFLLKSQDFSG